MTNNQTPRQPQTAETSPPATQGSSTPADQAAAMPGSSAPAEQAAATPGSSTPAEQPAAQAESIPGSSAPAEQPAAQAESIPQQVTTIPQGQQQGEQPAQSAPVPEQTTALPQPAPQAQEQQQSTPQPPPATSQAQPAQPEPAPQQQAVPQPAQSESTPQQPQQRQPAQPQPQQPAGANQVKKPGVKAKQASPKKMIMGCLGCSGTLLIAFVIFAFVFVSQTSPAGENPLATSLGIDTASFTNTLILLVNLVFGFIVIALLMLAAVGAFRIAMARKDDKETRKKGVKMAGISGILFVIFGILWVALYMFLSSKEVPVQTGVTAAGIITVPEITLNQVAPFKVQFDASRVPINTRQYDIVSYKWDFRDGGSSTVMAPEHTFKKIGIFDVLLTVDALEKQTNKLETVTFSKIVSISNIELTAVFEAVPNQGPAPLTVIFDASNSVAPAGEITSYDWDFTNNNIFTDGSGVRVTHVFERIGTYSINLRITDNTGQYAVTTGEISVSGENVPKAVMEIPTSDGKYFSGIQYTFKAEQSSSPNGAIEKYEWNFGDGTPKATTRTANHKYDQQGEYDVTLVVTDVKGEKGESVTTIRVETPESAPIAVIKTVPGKERNEDYVAGQAPFEISFDATGSQDADNNIVEFNWDFDGDGRTDSSGEMVKYVYTKEGVYNAKLTVIDAENNESSAIVIIRVAAQPLQARVTADPIEGNIPLSVTFDASSSTYPGGQIVSYEWDFGDGSPKRIDASKVTYRYTQVGTFNVSLTAIASDNSRSTVSLPINVRPVSLKACFEIPVDQGEAPLTLEFNPACSTGTITKYSWDFGDGTSTLTRRPTKTYNAPGSYRAVLEVSDNQNVIDTFSKNILVTGLL